MRRRHFLRRLALGGLLAWTGARADAPEFAAVRPRLLRFPIDHGAHPDYRTEWWYVTGWLDAGGPPAGFQVTFFRSRTQHDAANPSRFAPHQLLLAHAALAWPGHDALLHEERAARVTPGDAAVAVATGETQLALQGWRLQRDPASGSYRARIDGDRLQLDLALTPTQALLLQGEGGYSRKGPAPEQASYYYSQPQLQASGSIGVDGKRLEVSGRAWLDHEWSTTVLDAQSVGWDWLGLNLADGGALMAFRIRTADGSTRWAAARLRQGDGSRRDFVAAEIRFETLATWRSPRSGTLYPVSCRLTLGTGATRLQFDIVPLLQDQELDTRQSTGNIYWEGAVSALAAGRLLGRGYLELVGYQRALKL